MLVVVVPTVSSLTSVPSTAIRAVRQNRPPKDIEEKPALVGSKFSPSWIWTPGSSWAKSKKFRPLTGKFSICCAFSTPPTLACSVLTVTGLLVTSTTVDDEPSSSLTFAGEIELTRTVIVSSVVLKLGASTRTEYTPGGSEPAEYSPAEVVVVVIVALVS